CVPDVASGDAIDCPVNRLLKRIVTVTGYGPSPVGERLLSATRIDGICGCAILKSDSLWAAVGVVVGVRLLRGGYARRNIDYDPRHHLADRAGDGGRLRAVNDVCQRRIGLARH